jgi:hypothetical protein
MYVRMYRFRAVLLCATLAANTQEQSETMMYVCMYIWMDVYECV